MTRAVKLKESFSEASPGVQGNASNPVALEPERPANGGDEDDYQRLCAQAGKIWNTLPGYVGVVIEKELSRLYRMHGHGQEYGSTVDYLELLLELPWEDAPHQQVSLKNARQKLNASHWGMEKVKEHCIEYIAAMNSGGKSGGVLCLDGPPGVGKTSIARSIAAALRRPCVTVSLGGANDVTLLRGHGRTYSGSLPGVIIEAMRKAKVKNPVVILDEMDKAGKESPKGSVSHALLEVVDPSQNDTFKDHYLNLEYDLSDVLFIATTNDVSELSSALYDRLEVIPLSAYTDEEKMQIARKYLVPKALEECGLSARQLTIKDDALRMLVEDYTREAGVRKLEKIIKKICRKENVRFQTGKAKSATVSAAMLEDLIGPPQLHKVSLPEKNLVGAVTGLHASEDGGGVLPIQVTIRPSEKLTVKVTGLPGPMLKESGIYSSEGLEEFAKRYELDIRKLRKSNIHVHFTNASLGVEGPSAGAAITTAIISALTGIETRRDVAMTGEIDTRGNILPIGGLKQKLEGARRAGVTKVLIPWDNQRSLYHVPKHLKSALEIVPVKHIDEVLQHTLTEPVPLRQVPLPQGSENREDELMAKTANLLAGLLRAAAANALTPETPRHEHPDRHRTTPKPHTPRAV